MIGSLTALIFLSSLSQSVAEQIPVTLVKPGGEFMFKCSGSHEITDRINWFKQTLGQTMQFIAAVYHQKVLQDSFKDRRYSFTVIDNLHVINIKNITKEDEAIYSCQIKAGSGGNIVSSTFLIVDDEEKSQKCVHVRQSPSSASVLSGGSVSLQCSLQSKNNTNVQCPPQHKVHWFRAGSVEPHTGVMLNFTNNSCAYSLSKTIGQSSDAGTYHCAVDTCGHILFGDGTRVEMDQPTELHQKVIVALSVLLSCCVLVIIVLSVCLKKRRVCAHCRDALDPMTSPCDNSTRSPPQDGGAADVNYAALNFSSRKVKQGRKTRREQECVYSTVRADHLTSL